MTLKLAQDVWYELWEEAGSRGLDTWYETRHVGPGRDADRSLAADRDDGNDDYRER